MAAVAPQFRRSADLYSLPAATNAVAWSEDNILAVATGRSVILLNPAALGGPRGVIDVPFTQPTAAEGQPSGRLSDHLAFLISSVGRGPKPELRKSSTVRAVAWSPTGCGAAGGCLLAIVLVCGPPASAFSSQWRVLTDLTILLRRDPKAAAWLAALDAGNGGGSELLRLRGGGGRKRPLPPVALPPAPSPDGGLCGGSGAAASGAGGKANAHAAAAPQPAAAPEPDAAAGSTAAAAAAVPEPAAAMPRKRHRIGRTEPSAAGAAAPDSADAAAAFAAGDLVEVTNDEEGLCGCWFEGTVRDVQQGFALVEYAELMVVEDSTERLSEWFPLAEPAEKTEVSVLEAAAAQLPEGSDVHTRAGFALRPAPPAEGCQRGVARSLGEAVDAWSDGGWWRGHVAALGAGGVAASRSRRGAAQPPLQVARDGSGTEHAPQADVRTALEWDGGSWKPVAANGALAAAAAAGGSETAAEEGGLDAMAEPAASKPKRGKKEAQPKPAPYQVPERLTAVDLGTDLDLSDERRARQSAAELFARRFLAVRGQLPEEQRPTYDTRGQHLHSTDAAIFERVRAEVAAVHGGALAAVDAVEKKWLGDARAKLRQVWDRAADPGMEQIDWQGKRAAATAASGADADADADAVGTPAASALRRKPPAARRTPALAASTAEKRRPANQAEPYTVPDGFDAASALVECDISDSAAAKRTVPWAFLQRWLTLRDEVPWEERPTYVKGQHLRGVDSDLAERCRAEIMHAHGAALEGLRLSEKWLLKEAKVLIRLRVIKTRFGEIDEEAPPPASARSTPAPQESAERPAKRKRRAVLSPAALAAAAGEEEGEELNATRRGASSGDDYSGSEFGPGSDAQPSSPRGDASLEGESDGGRAEDGDDDGDNDSDVGGGTAAKRRGKRPQMPPLSAIGIRGSAEGVARGPRPAAKPRQPRHPRASGGSYPSAKAAASHGGATQPPKEAEAAPPPPLAAVSAAWSPVFPTAAAGGSPAAGGDASDGAAAGGSASSGGCRAGGAAVLLAVGTSGGLVWLWRLQLPAEYTLQHEPAGPQLELVSVLRVARCPVTALAWAAVPADCSTTRDSSSGGGPATLALAAGGADGGVRLFGAPIAELSKALGGGGSGGSGFEKALKAPLQLLRPLGVAIGPDGRGVVGLAAECRVAQGELVVAAGKHAGMLALWQGLLTAKCGSLQLYPEGGKFFTTPAHGSASVTGVCLTGGVAISCGADGGVAQWDIANGQPAAQERPPADGALLHAVATAKALLPASAATGGPSSGATGLALSPGGLCAAVVRTAFGVPAARRTGTKRMILGTMELSWLGGDCPPGGSPTLAARLPWLRRTLQPAAASNDGGGGDGASSGGGGGFASLPPATALWEAQAALCGVKCGAPMPPPRPSRSAAAFRHEPRVGLHQGYTKTDGGDASEGELAADEAPPNGDAADAAVAPEAGTEAAAAAASAAAAAQSAAEAEAAAAGAAAAHNALTQALDATLAPFEAGAEPPGASADSTAWWRGRRAAAAMRHMLPHMQQAGPAGEERLADADAAVLQHYTAGDLEGSLPPQSAADPAEDAALELPRCAASGAPLDAASAWVCYACGRHYALPPVLEAATGLRTAPHCVTCGVRVARAVPPAVLAEVGL